MMNYRMGQELVCINAEPWTNAYTLEECKGPNPVKDEIYHYAGAHLCCLTGADYICLEEFGGGCGPAFEASAFRPLVKTDISIFTAMLTPFDELVRA